MNPTNLFFYGTLMSHEGRSHALGDLAVPVSTGLLRGDLYSVSDAFPAFVEGDGVVVGEVWRPRDERDLSEILRILDGIEGYVEGRPDWSMYLREERALLAPNVVAYTYRWNRPVREDGHLSKIDGGDWRKYRWESAWAAA